MRENVSGGGRLKPIGLVVLATSSVQFGAALAKTLFDEAGPGGTVFLRVALAAVMLGALWRPAFRGRSREEWRLVGLYGLSLAVMNGCFYEALDRIPLGVAVTLEFTGPLAVAVAGSRRKLDLLWVALAAGGVLSLAAPGGSSLDPVGVAFAGAAAAAWAGYILIASRVGRAFPGGDGLALAMWVAGALLLPLGVADAGSALLDPAVLAIGAGVALLSSAIPYSAELEALRLLPERVFGILLSMEPALAALAGLMVLGQELSARDVLGIALVVAASAGAAAGTAAPAPRDA